MAQITGAQNERVFPIQKWLGLNESPDGDTKLKMGEAAAMRNWKVTRDMSLQKRPGTKEVLHLAADEATPVSAVWTGFVAGVERVVAFCGNSLYSCWNGSDWEKELIYTFNGAIVENPHMFGFDEKLYVLSGNNYCSWDGTTFSVVTGYRPLVAVAIPPDGGGELLEGVNKLNGLRRCWISPDGSGKNFPLPEGGTIKSATVKVYLTSDGSEVTTGWSYSAGVVSFTNAPAEGTNTYEIQWEVEETMRQQVLDMRYSETFNGSQDTRVFLYGDGGADAFYSGLDDTGKPTAEYFPDLNEIRIGVENTPITGMIRQYSRLVAFKTDGAWSIQFGLVTTADGTQIPGFYSTPVNRTIGNDAMGQVQLVLNDPVTLFGSDLYEWKSGSYGNLTNDERNAKRISDRVYATLAAMDLQNCRAFDDNYHQEYYVFNGEGKALVWNYAADVWYRYENFPMHRPFVFHGELYYGSRAGGIQHVSTDYAFDKWASEDAKPIECRWSSGSMAFGADYQRKYAAMIWLAIKPETHGEVWVTVQTDKSSKYQEKVVASKLFGFDAVDFSDFTFALNRKPQMKRLKIKAKKFVFYNLILESNGPNGEDGFGCGATVTGVDIRVRFTGYAK